MPETNVLVIPDGLWIEDLDEEIVILMEATDQIHILNETAAEIWRLVDGEKNIEQIGRSFAAFYPEEDPEALVADAEAVLRDLMDKKLVAPK